MQGEAVAAAVRCLDDAGVERNAGSGIAGSSAACTNSEYAKEFARWNASG